MAKLLSRKVIPLLLIALLAFAAGCGGAKTEGAKTEGAKTEKTAAERKGPKIPIGTPRTDITLPEKVKVGVINVKALPPQVVYGFEKGIYKSQFPSVDFKMELSKGHHDVAMKMAEGEWDVLYLSTGPAIEFVNYGYEKWQPAKYTILAGSQFQTASLMAKEDVKSIKDLDGKTVGITNKSIDKEMVLNKLLTKEGLKTQALGGTVKVIYDEPTEIVKGFQKGQIQAVYPMPSMVEPLKKGGAKVISDGTETEFGKQLSFSVMAVSNKFLDQYPDFVKEMVRIHVENTGLALENPDELVGLTFNLEKNFFKDDPKRVLTEDEVKTIYKRTQTTYDPNLKYLKDSYQLLVDAKYVKAMPAFDKWADFTFLNEVLKEKGLETVK